MDKIQIDPHAVILMAPTLIVGASIEGKPNFMLESLGTMACAVPPMYSMAMRYKRYTLMCIRQSNCFSINIPSIDLIKEADYCGIVSGSEVNKAEVCKFDVFYGELGAPLIEQCPINLECKVVHILDLGSHSVIIGRVEGAYASKNCITNGRPDIDKIKPFYFTKPPGGEHRAWKKKGAGGDYRSMGEVIAKAYSIGLELKSK